MLILLTTIKFIFLLHVHQHLACTFFRGVCDSLGSRLQRSRLFFVFIFSDFFERGMASPHFVSETSSWDKDQDQDPWPANWTAART